MAPPSTCILDAPGLSHRGTRACVLPVALRSGTPASRSLPVTTAFRRVLQHSCGAPAVILQHGPAITWRNLWHTSGQVAPPRARSDQCCGKQTSARASLVRGRTECWDVWPLGDSQQADRWSAGLTHCVPVGQTHTQWSTVCSDTTLLACQKARRGRSARREEVVSAKSRNDRWWPTSALSALRFHAHTSKQY